ncbi:hypothetical protein ACFWMP_31290 [Paenibacillus sp. NPDC058367]|jgi:hypothetical protein|uniref:hypothetical protein n=1 Tax=unclassified Paenibacillus TaxID=185978 RepID=UPI0030FAA450
MNTMAAAASTPIFSGTADWGFGASDVWTNVMLIVGSVSAFLILGICIKFAPKVFTVIFKALGIGGGKS